MRGSDDESGGAAMHRHDMADVLSNMRQAAEEQRSQAQAEGRKHTTEKLMAPIRRSHGNKHLSVPGECCTGLGLTLVPGECCTAPGAC